MKNCKLLAFAVGLMLLCFADGSMAWQGRMSGMNDPAGMVADESDILIHPAKIADGVGSNYYGDYRFSYIQVPRWEHTETTRDAVTGELSDRFPFKAHGSERSHEASLGGTWAFGPGRIGIFLEYSFRDGSYSGSNNFISFPGLENRFSLDTEAESFAARMIYGLPVDTLKLGAEIGFAHKSRANFTDQLFGGEIRRINTSQPIGFYDLSRYVMPLDADWNEVSFKASAEKDLGPGVLTFSPWIASVFNGSNKVRFRDSFGSLVVDDIRGTGDITGWSTGADLWYRARLDNTTSLPFVMNVYYDKKETKVSTVDLVVGVPVPDTERSEYTEFVFEIGGGVDKDIAEGTKIASGLYYDYLRKRVSYEYTVGSETIDHNEYPVEREHRLVWKAVCERAISPVFTARAGIKAFYGWVDNRYRYDESTGVRTQNIDTSGHRWGLSAAAGATVRVAGLAVEPFVMAGIQKTRLDTDSGSSTLGTTSFEVDLNSRKSEWTVGGGLSVKF